MKITRLALGGILAATTASAQNPPPTEPPVSDPAPPPVEVPPSPPPEATPAPPPRAEVAATAKPDHELDARYQNAGLLFNLNNVFTAGGVLGGWQGFGFGAQKMLGNGMTARLGVEVARATDPADIVKTTRINGMDVVVSYEIQLPPSGFTSQHAAAVVLDMIKPLTSRTIAPYLGAGLVVGYVQQNLAYTDEVTVTDQVTDVDNSSRTLSTGVRGIAGVMWKVNERFTLFAEYHLTVQAIAIESDRGATTTTNTASGTPATSRVETETEETRYFNFDSALGQGGSLGLVANF